MGHVHDVHAEWSAYPAARKALEVVHNADFIQKTNIKNHDNILNCQKEIKKYLQDGVLQQDYLFSHMNSILSCVRTANVSLRWRLLHRRSTDDKVRKSITDS